jgi:multisite-specific tRNA:(cytosine-C5)-methyltransferase
LRHYGDALELLDVSSQLPALKRRPGLTKWLVRDKKRWYSNYSQVEPPRNGGARLVPTMFPSAAAPPVAATERQVADEPVPGLDKSGEAVKEGDVQEGGEIEVAQGGGEGEEREEVVPEAEESGLPLHRSMRVVPHDQDTGGFFVAVFWKLKHLEGEGSGLGWCGSGLCTIWV